MGAIRKYFAATVLFAVLFVSGVANAADKYWECVTGQWDDNCWSATSGGALDGNGQPLALDNVYLYNSGTSNITVDYSSVAPSLDLGKLNINATGSGTMTFTQSSGDIFVYDEEIGSTGQGSFIQTGGTHTANRFFVLGRETTGNGTLTVSNTATFAAIFNGISDTVDIGSRGTGNLNILNGGTVTFNRQYTRLGRYAGSTGTATVNGIGSSWGISELFYVGDGGDGVLNIQNGGVVNVISLSYIGSSQGASGAVTVDGAGSIWTNSANLTVGLFGEGALDIINGGVVLGNHVYLGRSVRSNSAGDTVIYSNGVVTVNGVNSTLTASGNLSVGRDGDGVLNIQNGGVVSSQQGWLGENGSGTVNPPKGAASTSPLNTRGGSGAATVDGVGSRWDMTSEFIVGYAGSGTLNVQNGGVVSNVGNGYVAGDVGSNGIVTVDGADSIWATGNELYIGGFNAGVSGGAGVLNITNQGAVTVGADLFVSDTGTINIGSNSTLDVAGSLIQTTGDIIVNGNVSAGAVEVLSGNVTGNGTLVADIINNGGRIGPGQSPGTLTIDGNYTQGVGGLLEIEVSGLLGGEYDVLNILGTATFDAGTTINFSFIDGFAPTQDDSFDFLIASIMANDLSLLNFTYSGLEGGFLFDTALVDGQISFAALNDGVSAVPVPAAVWLFGSGLLGLIGIAKRKKA